ncbi:uncharacterized protein G2W53_001163 [Senna tora]|uniref:Retrotransposon gag domain-containing protein n=1 Tax=Senna tora TaxID=362788 RepID=A0A834XJ57_9FABA|nr:uncharacterized protein G2W53_001163 [Senna tora]
MPRDKKKKKKKKKKVVEISPPIVRERKRRGRAISHSPIRSSTTPSSLESIHSEEAEMAEQNNLNLSDYATPKLDGLLFPFSLGNKAKVWLQSLQEGLIFTWEGLDQQFLTKYFPPGKTAKLRNDITLFVHFDNESLYEACERFKDLLRRCGALMSKPVDDTYTLLETMSSNNHQWHSDRNVHARVAGIHDYDMFASLSSQIAALTKEVKSFGIQGAVKTVSPFVQPCENCGESNTSEQCPLVLESVQYMNFKNLIPTVYNFHRTVLPQRAPLPPSRKRLDSPS